MRRTADRPPEGSHEVRRTQPCFARQLIDRDAFVESRIDELEDALPNHRRQSTAQSRNARFGDAGHVIDLQAQARHERFHERQPARVAAIRFGHERAYQILDLRCLHAVHAA